MRFAGPATPTTATTSCEYRQVLAPHHRQEGIMTDLSHTAVANGELASALIVGLQLSGPAGSITAGAPGVGSGPAVSGTERAVLLA